MEFKNPKPKKKSASKSELILPWKNEKEITGIFNGQFVYVQDLDSMNYLYEAGNFGKGTLSRGEPNHHAKIDEFPKVILQHQFENHSKWNGNATYSCPKKYLGTVKNFDLSLRSINSLFQSSFCDSEEETWKSWKESHLEEVYQSRKNESRGNESSVLDSKTGDFTYRDEDFINFVNEILQSRELRKPKISSPKTEELVVLNSSFNPKGPNISPANINSRLERLSFLAEENLNLNLEESFFLKSQLGCLNIVDLHRSELSIANLWEKFNAVDKNFTERYVTYHYYRTKGWIVKSGLKFGGDFLLYKDGPAHYHSSYLVKVLDKQKKITWREFTAMNRLVETYNKDLILCNVLPVKSDEEGQTFPEAFTNNAIQEIMVRRWLPSKERFAKESKTS